MARNIHKNKPFVSNRELPEKRAKLELLDDLDEMFCQERNARSYRSSHRVICRRSSE